MRLRAYFLSGWGFLIPYLATYLLYTWLNGPVNPAAGDQRQSVSALLHVYWMLHGFHLLLGLAAIWGWWQTDGSAGQTSGQRLRDAGHRLLPWLCLALVFWIPGVYLEWPSDPGEHYARTNEWSSTSLVTDFYYWNKSSYFLTHSFLGFVGPASTQLRWFDVYYAMSCLLLCWQYYRLARAIGFGPGAATVFVAMQSLLMGNYLFGFYRYHGISSSLFAQIGTVALARIALDMAPCIPTRLGDILRRPSRRSSPMPQTPARIQDDFVNIRGLWRFLPSAALLPVLIFFSHNQGILIAGLGMAAVVCWRLTQGRPAAAAWLAGIMIVLSCAMVAWFPRHAAIDEVYGRQGWMGEWYGFNLFLPSSPAFDRAVAIFGAAGFINLLAALCLIRRNHLVAWLTLGPVLALSLPLFAIPFAHKLAGFSQHPLIFHRTLFAVLVGLALVALGVDWAARLAVLKGNVRLFATTPFHFVVLTSALAALVTLPTGDLAYNRLYNALVRTQDDLGLKPVVQSLRPQPLRPIGPHESRPSIARPAFSFVAYGAGIQDLAVPSRMIHGNPPSMLGALQTRMTDALKQGIPALLSSGLRSRFIPPILTQHFCGALASP